MAASRLPLSRIVTISATRSTSRAFACAKYSRVSRSRRSASSSMIVISCYGGRYSNRNGRHDLPPIRRRSWKRLDRHLRHTDTCPNFTRRREREERRIHSPRGPRGGRMPGIVTVCATWPDLTSPASEAGPRLRAVLNHPSNAGVIRSLCRTKGVTASVVTPSVVRDPFLTCGSHPDIVERVWDQLGDSLSNASRCILCGTPVLVHHDTGLVLAACYGTQYCVRLPAAAMPAALKAGCQTSTRWSNGTITKLSEEFGANWVFGCWAKDEVAWCRAVADAEDAV